MEWESESCGMILCVAILKLFMVNILKFYFEEFTIKIDERNQLFII